MICYNACPWLWRNIPTTVDSSYLRGALIQTWKEMYGSKLLYSIFIT